MSIITIEPGQVVEVVVTPPAPVAVVVTPPAPVNVAITDTPVEVGVTVPAPVEVTVTQAGARGPGGPAGAAGGASYAHHQATPAATWAVTHNLGRKPTVVLLPNDSPTQPVWTDVTYVDNNTLIIDWPAAVSGWAHL